jgi:serine/threonine protein kinase
MRIGELRRVLRESGVLGEAGEEPTPGEIADVLWLAALRRDGRRAPPAEDGPGGTEDRGPAEGAKNLASPGSEPGRLLPGSAVYAALPTRSGALSGMLVSAAGAPQLPDALPLARAMRPLRRRVPSATRRVLDEEASAELRAEQQLWLPVLIPDTEPAFDLALVIDDSESMALWGEKAREFQLLCERIGAFRDVRPWRLGASRDHGRLRPVLRSSRSTDARDQRELIDLSGRRLILVITDGVHPWWRPTGPLLPVLARWALASPLAIVQPFPQRLWARSPLRPVTEGFRPGWPGNGPTIARRERNGHVGGKLGRGSVTVPILELSPAALHRWAGIISGTSGVTPLPAAILPRQSAAEEELPGSAPGGNGESRDWADPARLVREFRATVSPAAYQLAGYLSAAPLTLPIMRLVQESMMPGTGPAELAEVFLSGLLLKSADTGPLADPERTSYVFAAGVRDALQSTLTRSEAFGVLDQVGRYLTGGRRGGRPFPVLLHGQTDDSGIRAAAEQFPSSFGRVSGGLLQRIGAGLGAILAPEENASGEETATADPSPPRADLAHADLGEEPTVRVQAAVGERATGSGWAAGRPTLLPGTRVAEYELVRMVGTSNWPGAVYLARDEQLGRVVALKLFTLDKVVGARFVRENRAVAVVDHPHIIPIYAAGEADGIQYIAMRFVPGGTLAGVLAASGTLSPRRAAGFISPVASALDAAHAAGLVHREVKPANILVDSRRDGREHPYLTDFGIGALTAPGHFVGTPDYAAPEQAGGLPVDGRADQYALACVAFEALTGRVPFKRDLPAAVLYAHVSTPPPAATSFRPDLPPGVDDVLAKAMAKDPDDRYPSCADFADALREALGLDPYDPSRAQPTPTMPISVFDGNVPPQPDPVSVTWTAVVTADRDYYDHIQAVNESDAQEMFFPEHLEERRIPLVGDELFIGRYSEIARSYPEIDLLGPPRDPGVHRSHARLVRAADGGWTIVDLGTENGILVNGRDVPSGATVPLQAGDIIHLGAWTKITITRG